MASKMESAWIVMIRVNRNLFQNFVLLICLRELKKCDVALGLCSTCTFACTVYGVVCGQLGCSLNCGFSLRKHTACGFCRDRLMTWFRSLCLPPSLCSVYYLYTKTKLGGSAFQQYLKPAGGYDHTNGG